MSVSSVDKKNELSDPESVKDHVNKLNNDSSSLDQPLLKKDFSILSLLGVGFGLTNSWFGISTSMVTGITTGGPLVIVYGILIIACVSACIGATLSELASAYPNAGGQFYWTIKLAPKNHSRLLAYMTGALAWFGALFTSASSTISIAQLIMGFYGLVHEDFEYKRWHVFIVFEILTFILYWFNHFGSILPLVSKSALYVSIFSFVVITITVLSCSSGNYNSAKFVFKEFNNGTGWSSSGMAFILGLINPNWSFSCLDSATHMAEEALHPERVIPITIMGTVAIGFITSFSYVIAMFFCINNLDKVISDANSPIVQIYYQSLKNKGGAIVLGAMLFTTGIGCCVASHTWQARLCWSFARDNGLPYSKYWKKIDAKSNLPMNAHTLSTIVCALIGCLYLASYTAYNSLVVGCISFLLLSYMIPVSCLLYQGRNKIKHGPFWLGPVGFFCNVVTILWALFALVIYSFPFTLPVTKDNMNYVSVFIVGFVVIFLGYWFVKAKKDFCPDLDKYYYDEND